MDRDPDRKGKATPHMRRLAASIARSAETARTLPGRLSRSLAPTREGRQRRLRNLLLLGLALLPFVVAMATVHRRGGHGDWLVVETLAGSPAEAVAGADRAPAALAGSRVRFRRDRVQAPAPLGCDPASYQWLQQPRAEVLAGLGAGEPGGGSGGWAPSLPAVVSTLRVECGQGRFDYHQADDGLLLRVGGQVLRLARR